MSTDNGNGKKERKRARTRLYPDDHEVFCNYFIGGDGKKHHGGWRQEFGLPDEPESFQTMRFPADLDARLVKLCGSREQLLIYTELRSKGTSYRKAADPDPHDWLYRWFRRISPAVEQTFIEYAAEHGFSVENVARFLERGDSSHNGSTDGA